MFLDNTMIVQMMLDKINTMYSNWFVIIPVLILLMIATITDVKSMKIPNKLNGAFLVLRVLLIFVIGFSWEFLLGGVLAFLGLTIPATIKMHKMGGDIKCLTVVGLYLGIWVMPAFLVITCILGLIYAGGKLFINKSKSNMPFAPFFLATHLILFSIALVI